MKHNSWLVALSFIPFAFLGFVFATVTTQAKAEPSPIAQSNHSPNPSQSNILYIVVDKTSKPNPRLVSIWGLFFSTQDQLMAEFVPLYPSKKSLSDTLLISKFFLDTNLKLDPEFMNLITEYFQINWNGFIVLDQDAEKDLTSELSSLDTIKTVNTQSSKKSSNSSIFFSSLCKFLKSPKTNTKGSDLLATPSLDANVQLNIVLAAFTWTQENTPFAACEVLE
jgi:hypothetical protein